MEKCTSMAIQHLTSSSLSNENKASQEMSKNLKFRDFPSEDPFLIYCEPQAQICKNHLLLPYHTEVLGGSSCLECLSNDRYNTIGMSR